MAVSIISMNLSYETNLTITCTYIIKEIYKLNDIYKYNLLENECIRNHVQMQNLRYKCIILNPLKY